MLNATQIGSLPDYEGFGVLSNEWEVSLPLKVGFRLTQGAQVPSLNGCQIVFARFGLAVLTD